MPQASGHHQDNLLDTVQAVLRAALARLRPLAPFSWPMLLRIFDDKDIRSLLPCDPTPQVLAAAVDRLLASGGVEAIEQEPELFVCSADAVALGQAAVERWNAADEQGRDLGAIALSALRDLVSSMLWDAAAPRDLATRDLLLPHLAQLVLQSEPQEPGWPDLLARTASTLIDLAPELFVDTMLSVVVRSTTYDTHRELRAINECARRFLKRRPRHPAAFAVARAYRAAQTQLYTVTAGAYGERSALLAAPLIGLATALDATSVEAVTLMEQARDLDGVAGDPWVWYHLGLAYARSCRLGEALDAYERARDLAGASAPYLAARIKLALATLTEPVIPPEQAEHARTLLRAVIAEARRFIAEGAEIAEEADEPIDPARLLLLDGLIALIWQSLFTNQLLDTLPLIAEARRVAAELLDEDHPTIQALDDWERMARQAQRTRGKPRR
jgi:hypothetical protein